MAHEAFTQAKSGLRSGQYSLGRMVCGGLLCVKEVGDFANGVIFNGNGRAVRLGLRASVLVYVGVAVRCRGEKPAKRSLGWRRSSLMCAHLGRFEVEGDSFRAHSRATSKPYPAILVVFFLVRHPCRKVWRGDVKVGINPSTLHLLTP